LKNANVSVAGESRKIRIETLMGSQWAYPLLSRVAGESRKIRIEISLNTLL